MFRPRSVIRFRVTAWQSSKPRRSNETRRRIWCASSSSSSSTERCTKRIRIRDSTHNAAIVVGAQPTVNRAPPRRPPAPTVTADMWAFTNLTRPGRSAFTGGHTSSAGYAGWSTQIVLPFQSFGQPAASSSVGAGAEALSSGSARINTHLRCGSVRTLQTIHTPLHLLRCRC